MNMKKMKRNLKKNKRFTLIELIIVIVVIGILAGMALPKFIGVQRNAHVGAMQRDLDVLEKAVLLYTMDTEDGSYPFLNKVSVSSGTLKDSLLEAGDDGSEVYELDMDKLKPYIEKLKYNEDNYLYSLQTGLAINEEGKLDGDNKVHHTLSGGIVEDSNTVGILPNAPDFADMSNDFNMYNTNLDLLTLQDGRTVTVLQDFMVVRDRTGNIIQTIEDTFSFDSDIKLIDKGNDLILVVKKYSNTLVNLKDESCTRITEDLEPYEETVIPEVIIQKVRERYMKNKIEKYKDKYIVYGILSYQNSQSGYNEFAFTLLDKNGEIIPNEQFNTLNNTLKDDRNVDQNMSIFLKVYDNGDLYYSTCTTFAKITLK